MNIPFIYVGCDVSKHFLDVFDPEDGTVFRIENTRAAIDAFLAPFADRSVFVVYEATGAYDRALRHALASAGVPGARVNPMMARRFAEARGRRAKTDMLDAVMLADLGAVFRPEPDAPPCPAREKLTLLAKRRDQLVAMRKAERTRLKEAQDAAIAASLEEMICLLSDRIAGLDQDINALIAESETAAEDARLLMSAPGVGPVAAATCVSLLSELGSLSPKKIASLAGLAPFNRDSGAMKGKRRIGGGRARVRAALYMAAISAIRCCDRYKAVYERIANRAGAKKVAIIAVARKLLTHLNAMIRDRKEWT